METKGVLLTEPEEYWQDTTACYTNTAYDDKSTPKVFPTGQTTQILTDNDLTTEDAGTITCRVTVDGA